MDDELFPIPEHDTYLITKSGKVWSKYKNGWKKTNTCAKGYELIRLMNSKKNKFHTTRVHKLMQIAFIGSIDKEINHIDGNKLNNNITNLELSDRSKNVKHAYENGMCSKKIKDMSIRHSKVSLEVCRNIIKDRLSGIKFKDISSKYNISMSQACSISHGMRIGL